MLNLKNTLDGYLKNVEVIGNTIQDTNNLANIRSVGDKVEGQELYKIDVVSCGKNLVDGSKHYLVDMKHETQRYATINGGGHTSSDAICYLKPGTYKFSIKDFNMSKAVDSALYVWKKNKKYSNARRYSIKDSFTITEDDIGITFYLATSTVEDTQAIFNKPFMVEEGTQVTPYEPYKEQKLEILSPVQLEKVGDVADKITCKDGVWGVEKNIINSIVKFSSFERYTNTTLCRVRIVDTYKYTPWQVNQFVCQLPELVNASNWDNHNNVGKFSTVTGANYLDIIGASNIKDITHAQEVYGNIRFLGIAKHPQFIPLPHDQQVKLRTFAGQTNIAFLTEIPGQIKAQVPKSLGATVNTHTEQIADLHNSLERVKRLEETTVSTVETESSFTTVDATSNGYFEDVKLEGKTLVNVLRLDGNWFEQETTLQTDSTTAVGLSNCLKRQDLSLLKDNTVYTVVPFVDYTVVKKGMLYLQLNSEINGVQNAMFKIQEDMFNKPTLITTKELTNKNARSLFIGGANCEYKVKNVKILMLEGDHTNNPPSYFEGLMSVGQDVEEVNIESVNENLFSPSLYKGVLATSTGKESSGTRYAISGYFICPYDNIYFGGDNVNQRVILHYDKDKNYIGFTLVNSNSYYTLPANSYYARIRLDINGTEIFDIDDNLKINLSRNNTEYIPHQSNKKPLLYYNPTTETWEKPVLREWDTIEKHSDGKYYYHKRSGEVVLNGSESWIIDNDATKETSLHFRLNGASYNLKPINNNYSSAEFICDKFTPINADFVWCTNTQNPNGVYEGIAINTSSFICVRVLKSKLSTQDVQGFKAWLQANPVAVVYQLAQEEVYECANIDLMTYSGETNYIINSGAISPKSLLKVHNNISNVVKILQEKVSLLENTFIAGLRSVLSGDMYSLATILYPEDFEQNDNTEQDIMVIPE